MGACTERGASMAPAAIRSMVLTDFPAFDRFDGALHAMHQQARPDLFAPCKHLFTQADFEKLLASPNEIALIAEVGDRPAGICMATIKEPPAAPFLHPVKAAHIGDLYVAEEYRRAGVGRALIESVRRAAGEKGAGRITLMVWPFNSDALRFYEKLGFATRSVTLEAKL